MTNQQIEIVKAIQEELTSSSRKRRFIVLSATRQPSVIRIKIDSGKRGRARRAPSLEGGVAAWCGSGSPVLAVSVEESLIYVPQVDARVPVSGTEITVSPPRFLE